MLKNKKSTRGENYVTEENTMRKKNFKHDIHQCGPTGAMYGFGFIGALIYYFYLD